MKTQHIPGPWSHSRSYKKTFDISDGMSLIANVKDCRNTEANARLIAAAPELLDATQSVLESLKSMRTDNTIDGCIMVLENAITKATGIK